MKHHIQGLCIWLLVFLFAPVIRGSDLPETLSTLLEHHCVGCHEGATAEGGLNFVSLDWNLEDPHVTGIWVKIHDQLASGEMPPEEDSLLESASFSRRNTCNKVARFRDE